MTNTFAVQLVNLNMADTFAFQLVTLNVTNDIVWFGCETIMTFIVKKIQLASIYQIFSSQCIWALIQLWAVLQHMGKYEFSQFTDTMDSDVQTLKKTPQNIKLNLSSLKEIK